MSGTTATPAELERARQMWLDGARTSDIAAALGKTVWWVYSHSAAWPKRRQRGHPAVKRQAFSRKVDSLCDDTRQTERRLYGDLLPDIQFLRRRGWAVHRDGAAIIVGNRRMAAAKEALDPVLRHVPVSAEDDLAIPAFLDRRKEATA